MSRPPEYIKKHPCACGTGYLNCMQGVRLGLKCCSSCDHPTRWSDPVPYTPEEIQQMKADAHEHN